MAGILAVLIFVAVALAIFAFGAALYAPSSIIGSRLRALGWQRSQAPERSAIKDRFEQALDPLSKALPLSPTDTNRTRGWLIQAGVPRVPAHHHLSRGSRPGCRDRLHVGFADQRTEIPAAAGGLDRTWFLHPTVLPEADDQRASVAHPTGHARCPRPNRHLRRSRTRPRPGHDARRRRLASCPPGPE